MLFEYYLIVVFIVLLLILSYANKLIKNNILDFENQPSSEEGDRIAQ
jgi:hypothetical protein